MDCNRRSFIKSTAMAAATAALLGERPAHADNGSISLPLADDPPAIPGIQWNKAPCRFCGSCCGGGGGGKENCVVLVAGDRQAEVNRGLLCVKGYHAGMAMYGEDRLTQPLLRRNGRLEPIEWDEAIDIVARRIMQSGKRFAIYGSGQWTIPEGYAAQKFMKGGLGHNQIDPNARLCMASAVTGFISTYGVDEPASCYDDLDACDVLINWGNNPAEMHPILFSRVIDRRSKGEQVTLIDIGTRRTRTTQQSDHYLEFEPHTDLAIANCIAQQVVAAEAYNSDFVEQYCNFRGDTEPTTLMGEPISFDEYRERIAKYTPQYVAELSGVPEDKLRLLGELFSDPDKRIVSLWCMGFNQHTRGTAINNLVHAIHLLSGHWGRPGDGPQSLTGQPSACGTVREVGTLAHALPGGRVVTSDSERRDCEQAWNLPEGRISPEPGHHTVRMWEAFNTPTDEGGDIDTIWVQVTNPGQSLPNTHKLFKAKAELADKFLIVSDVYPTATTELADLVLPSAMWVEKNGVVGNSERRTQQWFKMVDPPGEARPDLWQTLAVAHRLMELGHEGMRDHDDRFLFHMEDDQGDAVPVWQWEHFYDINVDERLYEEYRPLTAYKHKNVAPYQELVKRRGMRWPVVETAPGQWEETRWRFVEGYDPNVEQGRGIQFYHSPTDDDRAMIFFRPYEDPPEMPDEEYPLWLCTGRVLEHWHTGSMTRRIRPLHAAVPRAYLEMNPREARRMGIANGETVMLETRRGSLRLPVWLDGRGVPPEGSVFVPFYDEQLPINDLTLHLNDPFSRQPDYKKCATRVRKLTSQERQS